MQGAQAHKVFEASQREMETKSQGTEKQQPERENKRSEKKMIPENTGKIPEGSKCGLLGETQTDKQEGAKAD